MIYRLLKKYWLKKNTILAPQWFGLMIYDISVYSEHNVIPHTFQKDNFIYKS